jgi:hypothetical protein
MDNIFKASEFFKSLLEALNEMLLEGYICIG